MLKFWAKDYKNYFCGIARNSTLRKSQSILFGLDEAKIVDLLYNYQGADMNSLCDKLKAKHAEHSMPSLIRDIYQKNTYHDQAGMIQ